MYGYLRDAFDDVGVFSVDGYEFFVAAALDEALGQVRKYLGDPRLARRYPGVRHVGLGVVFHGWEMAAFEAVEVPTPAPASP